MKLKSYISQWMSVHCHLVGIVRRTMMLLCFCTLAFVQFGCAKVDLIEFWKVKGRLIIEPDNSVHTLPALTYRFYFTPRYGDKVEKLLFTAPCNDGCGNYANSLSMGTYRTIAVCAQTENVEFIDMEDCEMASVRAIGLEGETSIFLQPSSVYAVSLPCFELDAGDTIYHYPKPVLLTKQVILTLSMNRELFESIIEVRGVFRGICPEARLFSCASVLPDPKDAPFKVTEFAASPSEGTTYRSVISMFDICNPMYGNAYTNRLSLSIYSKTEGLEHLDVDISTVLSDAIADNNGMLPLTVPIEIKIVRGYVGLESEVVSWEESGDSEHEVPRPSLTPSLTPTLSQGEGVLKSLPTKSVLNCIVNL